MSTFSMLHGTERIVDDHRIGVIASGVDDEGVSLAYLGIIHGDSWDKITVCKGEEKTLSSGWVLRLLDLRYLPEGAGKATIDLELSHPGD